MINNHNYACKIIQFVSERLLPNSFYRRIRRDVATQRSDIIYGRNIMYTFELQLQLKSHLQSQQQSMCQSHKQKFHSTIQL